MHTDVIVVGAGLVGSALVAGLGRIGLQVAWVGAIEPPPPAPAWDSRIYALSPGSVALLRRVGAWQRVAPDRTQPVLRMDVRGDRAPGRIAFDSLEVGEAALATIVENGRVARALWDAVQDDGFAALRTASRPARMVIRHDAVEMALDDGTALTAALVVGADGRDSWVRQAAGIGVRRRDYPQHAVVANFRNAEPHRGTARQWFRRDGVLALLPLPDDHVSMVWSAQESVALELMAAEPEVLSVRVAEAAGIDPAALGTVTPAADFELRAMAASKLVAPRLALVGDAAHNVHPLAGQGVNLGFRDVRELIDVLGARGAEPDVGSLSLLRRYERARREDQAVTLAVTDGLQRLFAARAPGVSWIRNVGMALSDRNAGLKQRLMRHALG